MSICETEIFISRFEETIFIFLIGTRYLYPCMHVHIYVLLNIYALI